MKENQQGRRDFIKSAAGIGGMAITTTGESLMPDTSIQQNKRLKIVCVGAHPGDPEFGCGGTMAKYADAGHEVVFLYLTKGEASDPTKSHGEMAKLRMAEAAISCGLLKAKPEYVGQIDGDTILNAGSNSTFQKTLNGFSPDIVFTQWPIDSHQDHQVAGLLVLNAWARGGKKFHVYFYEVNTGSETMVFVPTDYVDITSVRDKKKQALFAHKTQDPINTYNKYFAPLEVFRGLEFNVSAAEAFIHFNAAGNIGMVGL